VVVGWLVAEVVDAKRMEIKNGADKSRISRFSVCCVGGERKRDGGGE
jgi:hypothetical protein